MHTRRQQKHFTEKKITQSKNIKIKQSIMTKYNRGIEALRSFMLLRIIAAADHSKEQPHNGPTASLAPTRSAGTVIGG
jgi:hypothetical protein